MRALHVFDNIVVLIASLKGISEMMWCRISFGKVLIKSSIVDVFSVSELLKWKTED